MYINDPTPKPVKQAVHTKIRFGDRIYYFNGGMPTTIDMGNETLRAQHAEIVVNIHTQKIEKCRGVSVNDPEALADFISRALLAEINASPIYRNLYDLKMGSPVLGDAIARCAQKQGVPSGHPYDAGLC